MNDLDRDLRELFNDKASSVEAAPSAPADVLRRGRRRQVRTVIAGSLTAIAALTVALAAAARLTGGPTQVPVTNPPYGARIATIHCIAVTAPEGWTLIDDWPLASILPTTSQTCSFSATGSPFGPSPARGTTSSEPVVQPSSSCTAEAVPLPAGIPVLQLANFGLPLDGTVCHVGDLRPIDLPADGVAAYVASFPQGVTTEDFLAACPGGATVTTFADQGSTTTYAAVSLIGPDASPGDVATVDRFMTGLDGLRVPDDQRATASPGYVVAAGVDGGTTWRLEAGFPFGGSGSGIGATLITTGSDGKENASEPLAPATSEDFRLRSQGLADGSGSLLWGTARPSVRSLAYFAPSDGRRTDAVLIPWPDGLRGTARTNEESQLDGSIWYAFVSEPLGGFVVNPPAPPSTSNDLAATALECQIRGRVVTAFGHSLGHDWTLQLNDGELTLSLDGAPPRATFAARSEGDGGQVDVPGGTFLVSVESAGVTGLQVSSDVPGKEVVGIGRWMPAGPHVQKNGRVWIVALPGTGVGFEQVTGRLPRALSWPSTGTPTTGSVLSAGSDDSVSWALQWTAAGCPVLGVIASADGTISGPTDCLTPWTGGDRSVDGVAGAEAVAVITGPGRMLCTADDHAHEVGSLSSGTVAQIGDWANTGSCIVTVPVGHTVTVHLTDENGRPILGTHGIVRITAQSSNSFSVR